MRILLHIEILSRIVSFSPIEYIDKTKLWIMKERSDALLLYCSSFLPSSSLDLLYLSAFVYFSYCPTFIRNYICSYNDLKSSYLFPGVCYQPLFVTLHLCLPQFLFIATFHDYFLTLILKLVTLMRQLWSMASSLNGHIFPQ